MQVKLLSIFIYLQKKCNNLSNVASAHRIKINEYNKHAIYYDSTAITYFTILHKSVKKMEIPKT